MKGYIDGLVTPATLRKATVVSRRWHSLLTLKIPDGPDSGPVDPIRVHDSCTYFEKMLGTIGYESGSNMGVFRFLTSQGIQNNLDPDRVHSRT